MNYERDCNKKFDFNATNRAGCDYKLALFKLLFKLQVLIMEQKYINESIRNVNVFLQIINL